MDPVDLERRASRRLHPSVYDFIAGGAGDELSVSGNRLAWQRFLLRPRVLLDVSTVTTATSILGEPVALPVVVAPMGQHCIAHHEGELATARAAAERGVLFAAATFSTISVEDIASIDPGAPRWFQSYVMRDRGIVRELLERAANSGYKAVVLTVDAPVPGDRWRDRRNGYWLPTAGLRLANFPTTDEEPVPKAFSVDLEPALTPDLLAWMADISKLPIVVKGVLRADDARVCVEAGADAIVVSNHGGRQLDGAMATADALSEIVDEVRDEVEVYVDGGLRTGVDILRALALGARAVLIGRPIMWGLAIGGYEGVCEVLDDLRLDLERAMRLTGVTSVVDVPRDLVVRAPR